MFSCQGSLFGCLDVIRAKNYEIPRKIEEELLLLVVVVFCKFQGKSSTILYNSFPLLQVHYEYSDKRIISRILIANTLLSLEA